MRERKRYCRSEESGKKERLYLNWADVLFTDFSVITEYENSCISYKRWVIIKTRLEDLFSAVHYITILHSGTTEHGPLIIKSIEICLYSVSSEKPAGGDIIAGTDGRVGALFQYQQTRF